MLRFSIDHLDDLAFFKTDKFWFHQETVLGIWKVEFWGIDWCALWIIIVLNIAASLLTLSLGGLPVELFWKDFLYASYFAFFKLKEGLVV